MRHLYFWWRLSSLCLLGGLLAGPALGQQRPASSPWQADAAAQTAGRRSALAAMLYRYQALTVNVAALRATLAAAPAEGSGQSAPVLTLPLPDGGSARFRLSEAPVMAPELAARFPEIRTYTGVGLDDATATLRCDFTPRGFHAQVLSPVTGSFFIDPVSSDDPQHYLSYYKRDLNRAARPGLNCGFQPTPQQAAAPLPSLNPSLPATAGRSAAGSGATLRTYRLAVAATGEYTTARGGTVASALASIVTTVNRVVGVYEKELAVRMTLIGNNNSIIYTNGSTDPYTNNNGEAMLTQNQTTLTSVIGAANYDIGHVFSTGGGGIAYLQSVCNASLKAGGVTGSPNPTGDAFDIDYVAHEMGHQFGGRHTFNSTSGSCSGNRSSATAFEPGSGSTIQAYAGICDSDDLQNNSDAYFHSGSFEEMRAFIASTSCGTSTNTSNTPPVVSAPANGKTIPANTPFKLTASATDAEGDALTYCWEQMDLGPAAALTTAQVANSTVPLFRSFTPVTSPTRYFPRLANILSPPAANSISALSERLPTVTRSLKFRCTARDQHDSGGTLGVIGGVDYSPYVTLNVVSTAGPFVVTAPNTAVTWAGNSTQTVTWNVANTNAAPVSCATVNVRLSTDGGQTYPTLLAAGVPNNGSTTVTLPNTPTTQARLMVEAADNYFFDLSDANFTITAAPGTLSVTSFSPVSGPAGTVVTITGTGFTAGTGTLAVSFNGTAAPTLANITATSFQVTVPAGATTGQLVVTKGSSTANAGIFTVTLVATAAANGPICAGSTLNLSAGGGGSYSWTGPNGFSSTQQNPSIPNATLAASGTYTVTVTSGSSSGQASVAVQVNSSPGVVSITPSSATTCPGGPVSLTASVPALSTTLLSENFDAATLPASWTVASNGTPTPATTEWKIRNTNYSHNPGAGLPRLNNFEFNNSRFILANSDAGGSGSVTSTTLTSPAFSTVGYSAAQLSFQHLFEYYTDSQGFVEISTDGGTTWTPLATYTSTQGTTTTPATPTLSLSAYLNKSSVRLRWRYEAPWGYWWGLENVSVTGTPTPISYAWTLVSGNGLPATVNTAGLSVSPTATSTYQVTASNGGSCTSTGTVTVTVVTESVWTGAVSTDWFAAGNWVGCVPSAAIDARIPASRPRYPSLTATAAARTLTIENGGALTVGTRTLQLAGSFVNQSATAYTATGTLVLQGTNPQLSGVSSVNNLTLELSSGAVTLPADLTVNGALTLTSGRLNTGPRTVTLGTTATIAETETSYVTGTVQATRALAAGTANSFGGLGLTLTPAAGSVAPGSTLVIRSTGTAVTGEGNTGIERYFDIRPATNAGLNVTLAFRYFDHELNGAHETDLTLFRSVSGPAGPWQPQGQNGRNAGTNTVTKTGIAAFSIWTLGDATRPLPVTLTSFTAERQNTGVQLGWITAAEQDNAYFAVERSPDGLTFTELGRVAGQGTRATAHSYTWRDERLPAGTTTLHYRLRQVDHDGTSSYSPPRLVTLPLTARFAVFPTTIVDGQLRYEYQGPAAEAVLDVYSVTGQHLRRVAGEIGVGGALPVHELPAGWYVLKLITAQGHHTARFYRP